MLTRTKKIFAGAVGILLAVVIASFFLIFYFGVLEFFVNRELKSMVEGRYKASIEIGDIGGDIFNSLHLKDVVINYEDSAQIFRVAYIPSLYAEYDYTDIWKGRFNFKSVFIDSASIILKKTESGEWLIPQSVGEVSEGNGEMDFVLRELGLQGLKIELQYPDDTISFNDIIMKAHVEAVDNTFALDIDALSYSSSDKRFSLSSGGGKATLAGSNLLFQDIFLFTQNSKIKLDGRAVLQKRPEIDVRISAENIHMPEVASLVKINLKGDLAVQGNVSLRNGIVNGDLFLAGDFMERNFDSIYTSFELDGRHFYFDTLHGNVLDGCKVEGKGELDIGVKPEEYSYTGTIDNFWLKGVVGNSFDTDLNGRIQLNGLGLKKETLDMDFNVDLGESWFDKYHAYSAIGNLKVTHDSIMFDDGFRIRYHDNDFVAGGKIEYRGDVDIDGRAYFNDLSAFNDKIFVGRMAGRGEMTASITGPVANPDLQGRMSSDSIWLYDVFSSGANFDFDVNRFLYDREGEASAFFDSGYAYSISMDSAFLIMDIDSENVTVVSSSYYNQFIELDAVGNLDYHSYPQVLAFDTVDVDLFDLPLYNDSTIVIKIDSTGFDFERVRLDRPVGDFEWSGRLNFDETADLEFSGSSIEISPWADILRGESEVGGKLSGRAAISGNLLDPIMSFTGKIDSLSYEDLILGNLETELHYRDRVVQIDSIYINSGSGEYFADGYFPIDLSFDSLATRLLEDEMDVDIIARDDSLKLVALIFDDIDYLNGDFQTALRMTGTPLQPEFYGQAQLRDGILKAYQLVNPFVDLNVLITMDGRTIRFDTATAVTYKVNDDGRLNLGSEKGVIDMTGSVEINSIDSQYFNLAVEAANIPGSYELGDINGRLSADLVVTGYNPPLVFGDVNITEADYNENFTDENQGWYVLSEIEMEKSWDLNLNTEFASNVWVKNDDIDAEMSGTVNLIRESGKYRFIGEVEILRGKAYIAQGARAIRFDPGGMIYYDDIEYPNPRLDIPATTRIRKGVTDPATGETDYESFDLAMHIGGTLDEPLITAPEGSEYNTEDIATLMVTDFATGDQAGEGFDATDRAIAAGTDLFNAQATRVVNQLGVETLEIDPFVSKHVTVGTYFNPNLYLYGRVGTAQESGQEVGFEYRIEKFMLLEGKVDQENLYNLLLNFYWEY